MIGLVLVTHGRLADEFLNALEHVVGKQSNIETISIGPEDDMEARRTDILEAVARADDNDGVIMSPINDDRIATAKSQSREGPRVSRARSEPVSSGVQSESSCQTASVTAAAASFVGSSKPL